MDRQSLAAEGARPAFQGSVPFAAQDKQELSLVVATKMSGQEIEGVYKDTVLQDSTWCVGQVRYDRQSSASELNHQVRAAAPGSRLES